MIYIILLTDRRPSVDFGRPGRPMAALGRRSDPASWRPVSQIDKAVIFTDEREAHEVATDYNQSQSRWRAIVFEDKTAAEDFWTNLERRWAASKN